MKWCCIGFKAHYEAAGSRGTACLVGRDFLGEPEFQIQWRAVDEGDENQIDSNVLASVITDIRITFCPWCGVKLARFYRKSIDYLFREGFELGLTKKF
jgi:hypothetical protein